MRSGDLDAAEMLGLTLARIGERDQQLNSTPVVFPDSSRAMLADAPAGPLHGVPVTVKDMFALPWRGAYNGTPFELFPAAPSGPFRRLRDAGAVVVGVANQHELGLGSTGTTSAYGPMPNPWDLEHCAGGSSGGSAAGVAARLVAASLASDSGGSTRLPAAYCGVVGLKLTYRSLPYDGYFGIGTTFSAPGLVTRDGGDARLLTEALLNRELPPHDGSQLRVGVVRSPFWDDVDPDVAGLGDAALRAAGWPVTEIVLEHLEVAAGHIRSVARRSRNPPARGTGRAELADPGTAAGRIVGSGPARPAGRPGPGRRSPIGGRRLCLGRHPRLAGVASTRASTRRALGDPALGPGTCRRAQREAGIPGQSVRPARHLAARRPASARPAGRSATPRPLGRGGTPARCG